LFSAVWIALQLAAATVTEPPGAGVLARSVSMPLVGNDAGPSAADPAKQVESVVPLQYAFSPLVTVVHVKVAVPETLPMTAPITLDPAAMQFTFCGSAGASTIATPVLLLLHTAPAVMS
jgi:hypothetical protein